MELPSDKTTKNIGWNGTIAERMAKNVEWNDNKC
jgi:hypothetical protein